MKTKRSTNRKNKSDNLTISLEQLKNQFIFVTGMSGLWTQTRSLVLLTQRSVDTNNLDTITNFYYSIHDIDLLRSKYSNAEQPDFSPLEFALERFIFIDFMNQFIIPKAKIEVCFAGLYELIQSTTPGLFELDNDDALMSSFSPPIKITLYSPDNLLENIDNINSTPTTYELSDLIKDIYCQKLNYKSRKFKYEFKKDYPITLYVDVCLDIENIKSDVTHAINSDENPNILALYKDLHENKVSKLETLFGPNNKKHLAINLYIEDRFIPESANSFSDLDDVYYTILKDGLNQILADKKFSPFKSFSELCENYHNTVSVSIKQHRDLSQVLDSDENHSIKEIKMVLQPIDPQQYDKVEIEAS